MKTRITNDYGKFAQIPVSIARDPSLSSHAVRLYAIIWSYSDADDRDAHPGRKKFAAHMAISLDTVDRAMRELVEYGAIAVEPRFDGDRQTTNIYRILVIPTPAAPMRPPSRMGAEDGGRMGAAQDQEPEDQGQLRPVLKNSHQGAVDNSATGRDSNRNVTPSRLSKTHGHPLSTKDVFTSVGDLLPDDLDDKGLEELGADIVAASRARVLDPTAYVIRTIRRTRRNDDDRARWIGRAVEIAQNRAIDRSRAAGF